jgi:hypothetical protein
MGARQPVCFLTFDRLKIIKRLYRKRCFKLSLLNKKFSGSRRDQPKKSILRHFVVITPAS